jgi:hypothetical protein
LPESFEDAFFAGELSLGGEMLPSEQPAHIDRRSDWLDLLAKGGNGSPVNALKNASFAPLNIVVCSSYRRLCRCGILKRSAYEKTLRLHREGGLEDSSRFEIYRAGESV